MPTLRRAWQQAALGPRGFYTHGPGAEDPSTHFRTAPRVAGPFVDVLADGIQRLDATLHTPRELDVVEIGAGRGELLESLLVALPTSLTARIRMRAVDVRPRPDGLDDRIAWTCDARFRPMRPLVGLLLANEWLDDIPLDIVELDEHGRLRIVVVDESGREQLGPMLGKEFGSKQLSAWITRWWPLTHAGSRAEIGTTRDRAWARAVSWLSAGTALAIDYGHVRAQRSTLLRGTLSAYANGRQVRLRFDGGVNITAHVAMDSCADAVTRSVPNARVSLTRQRDELVRVGMPAYVLAARDPAGYTDGLLRSAQSAELRDPDGLGAFWWLRADVGLPATHPCSTGC